MWLVWLYCSGVMGVLYLFFFNDTATTEIYTYGHTLSLHDALPISATCPVDASRSSSSRSCVTTRSFPTCQPWSSRWTEPPCRRGICSPPRSRRPRVDARTFHEPSLPVTSVSAYKTNTTNTPYNAHQNHHTQQFPSSHPLPTRTPY